MWQRGFRGLRILVFGAFLISLSGCDVAKEMEQMFRVGEDISRDLKNELGVDAQVMAQSYGSLGSMVSVQLLNATQVENISLSDLRRSIEPIIKRHHGTNPSQLIISAQYMRFGDVTARSPAVSVSDTGSPD